MLVIRLRRIGRHKDPHYRIVVTEHTAPVQGKFLAEIGHYHPKSKELGIDKAAFTEWMNKGAKPSNTVARIAQRAEIEHKHIAPKQENGTPKKKAVERATAKAEKAAAPAPAHVETEAPAEEVVTEEVTVEEETTEAPAEEVVQDEPATEEAVEAEAPADAEATDSEETSEAA